MPESLHARIDCGLLGMPSEMDACMPSLAIFFSSYLLHGGVCRRLRSSFEYPFVKAYVAK